MKNPFEFTISEACALIGETPELMTTVCQIFNKQQEIAAYKVQEIQKLITNKPKKERELILSVRESDFEKLA